MSVCVHPFFFRKVWIRFPNRAKSACLLLDIPAC
jgi:hypothetical protein